MNKIVHEDIESIIASNCVEWNRFKNKTFLITGASGMLPSYMALTLLALNRNRNLNIKVLALVRNKKKAHLVFNDYLSEPNLEFVVQDVCEPIKINEPIDFIIHAASQASPKYYGSDPVGTARANVIGTDNLLRVAYEKSVKCFLYFSSSTIYGQFPSSDITLEENQIGTIDPLNANSCYFESKRMGENLCIDYFFQYKVPTKIIRIFHTLGPGMDISDGRAFSDFCRSIVEGKDIILKSDGSALRTFLYVTDAVRAYFTVILKGKPGEAYNIGSATQEVSMRNLAEKLVHKYPEKGNSVIISEHSNTSHQNLSCQVNRIIPDTKKINNLGWHESIKWEDAFFRTIDSLTSR